MSKVNEIYGQITDIEELKKFAQAQHDMINQLTEQNKTLLIKNKDLEKLLSQNVVLVGKDTNLIEKQGIFSSEEEQICRDQLRVLNEISKERELTIEETRKVEIFSKILLSLKDNNKKPKSAVEKMDSASLLKLVESNDS